MLQKPSICQPDSRPFIRFESSPMENLGLMNIRTHSWLTGRQIREAINRFHKHMFCLPQIGLRHD